MIDSEEQREFETEQAKGCLWMVGVSLISTLILIVLWYVK